MIVIVAFTLTLACNVPLTGRCPNVLIGAVDSTLFFFYPGEEKYYVVPVGDRVVDLAAGLRCYVLTEHTLLTIDPATRAIQHRSFVPLRYTSLDLLLGSRGSDSLLAALSSDELSLVDPIAHRYVNGIGLAAGEHEVLFTPMTRRFHLVTSQLFSTLLELYDLTTGRCVRRLKVNSCIGRIWQDTRPVIYAVDTSGLIIRLSPDLKSQKSLGRVAPGPVVLYPQGDQLIAVTANEIVLLDGNTGKVLDRKIEQIDGSAVLDRNTLFVFHQPSEAGDDGGLSVIDIPTLVTRSYFSILDRIEYALPVDSTTVIVKTARDHVVFNVEDGTRSELSERLSTPSPPPAGVSPDSCYYLQIGAYQRADKAFAVIETLARQGVSAYCDSSTQFYRVRLGGFKTRETAELFAERYPKANWIVFTARYQGSPVPNGFLSAFSIDRDLLVFRLDDGTLRFLQRLDDFDVSYVGPPTCRDSTLEIRRVDGLISTFRFREGGLHEEIKDIQE